MTKSTSTPSPDKLKSAIEKAGGTLRIPNPPKGTRRAYRRVIHVLLNGDLLRPERRLRYSGRDRGDLVITIEEADAEPPPKPTPRPILVPSDLRGCHPIIRATREHERRKGQIDTGHIPDVAHVKVFGPSFRRCLLVLQAIINEADRRGYGVTSGGHCHGLQIVIQGHAFEVAMYEDPARTPHEPTKSELERSERYATYGWMPRIAKYDHQPSGKLSVRSDHGTTGSVLASGGKRWRLEKRLWQVFDKLEKRAAEVELRDEEWRRREELAERARQSVLAEARERYFDQKRIDWLDDQLDRWNQIRCIHEFVAAARSRDQLSEDDIRWIDWVEDFATEIDPLKGPLGIAAIVEPTAEDLAPFITTSRWSIS